MAVTGAPPRLVVLRALKLGDLLTVVPALRALARAFPDHERVLAAPAWLTPLADHIGATHRVVPTEPLSPLDASLHGADVAVNLHGKGPQSTTLLAATNPHRLLAYGRDGRAWRPGEHEVRRWCRLLEESGIPADPTDLQLDPAPVAPPALARGATVIHPGASTPSRCWPVERWAEVARAEARAGRTVVVTGGEGERALAARLAAAAGLPDDAVLAGRTDLLELAAVIGTAARVLCGDTGVAHLATALGTPSVVLFGPVPPSAWGPPPSDRHVVLWAGQLGDPHADAVDDGLLAIGVDDVLSAVERLPVADAAVTVGATSGAAPAR